MAVFLLVVVGEGEVANCVLILDCFDPIPFTACLNRNKWALRAETAPLDACTRPKVGKYNNISVQQSKNKIHSSILETLIY